jgi:hypothetical protein
MHIVCSFPGHNTSATFSALRMAPELKGATGGLNSRTPRPPRLTVGQANSKDHQTASQNWRLHNLPSGSKALRRNPAVTTTSVPNLIASHEGA